MPVGAGKDTGRTDTGSLLAEPLSTPTFCSNSKFSSEQDTLAKDYISQHPLQLRVAVQLCSGQNSMRAELIRATSWSRPY